jgi:hypothetical protein
MAGLADVGRHGEYIGGEALTPKKQVTMPA